jgi:hypothetical protein
VITYSLLVLSPKPSQSHDLLATCREGGLVNSLVRQLPGCMNISVLISNHPESEILVIAFFDSIESAIDGTSSPMGVFLFGLLERMAKRSRNLGLFTFPITSQTAPYDPAASTTYLH